MRRFIQTTLAVAAMLYGVPAVAGTPSPPRQINLVNETEVSIGASCAVVWKLLLSRESWIAGFIHKQTLSGTADQAGEIAFVHTVLQGRSNDRFEEVVIARPEQRYLLAMMVPDAGITTFSDYQMRATEKGCDVGFSVKLTKLLGKGERAGQADGLRAGTQEKIEKDLLNLKAVAERGM